MKVFHKFKNKNFQFNTNNLEFIKLFDNVFKHHLDITNMQVDTKMETCKNCFIEINVLNFLKKFLKNYSRENE